jgi:N-acetylglucosaminyl-diphospho-decaprenol L-rhamnosyltransferase
VTSSIVTVVVVSYQTRDLLRRCLSSLHGDVARGFATVVVVDNGSTDHSPQMVRDEFPWSKLVTGFGNLGYGAAVNLGAQGCTTRWLAAANADIELVPGTLSNLVEIAERHPGAAAFAPRLELPSGGTQRSTYRFPRASDRLLSVFGAHRFSKTAARRMEYGAYWSPASRNVDWVAGAFMLFRKEAFDAVGGFDDTQWMYSEDMDICWRLARSHWDTRYVAETTVRHVDEGAVGVAFAGRSQTLKLAAHFAWLEDRRGCPVMIADAAAEVISVTLRRALLWPLQRWCPKRWRESYNRVERWRQMTFEALRIRNTVRRGGERRGNMPYPADPVGEGSADD